MSLPQSIARCLPHVLRRPEACDPSGGSCWATWTPARRERPGLVYDEPEAAEQRESDARELRAYLARLAAHPPAPTRFLSRRYPGRPAELAPLVRTGVVGDLAAALREIPDRRSRAARAASGGGS